MFSFYVFLTGFFVVSILVPSLVCCHCCVCVCVCAAAPEPDGVSDGGRTEFERLEAVIHQTPASVQVSLSPLNTCRTGLNTSLMLFSFFSLQSSLESPAEVMEHTSTEGKSLTHTLARTLSYAQSHTCTHSCAHSHTLLLTHSDSYAQSLTRTLSHTRSYAHSLTHSLSRAQSHTLSHALTL